MTLDKRSDNIYEFYEILVDSEAENMNLEIEKSLEEFDHIEIGYEPNAASKAHFLQYRSNEESKYVEKALVEIIYNTGGRKQNKSL